MATDFGNLNAFQDDYDLTFKAGRKTHKIRSNAAAVLRYKTEIKKIESQVENYDNIAVLTIAAPLLGAVFNEETFQFEDGPEGTENHNLLSSLKTDGADDRDILRLVGAAAALFHRGEEFGLAWYKTGDLGKATALLIEKITKEKEERETQQTAGETSADD